MQNGSGGSTTAKLMYIVRMRSAFLKILLACVVFLAVSATGQQAPPALDLQDLKGGHHKLQDYKGKVVLLNFWATWCVPCAGEMPLLSEMQRRYKNKIVVIAASIDDEMDRDNLKPFLHKHQADNLTLMVGPTLDTLSDFGMGGSLPGTVFINAKGEIVGKKEGALKRPELEKRLAEMTGTPAPKTAKAAQGKKTGTSAEK